MTEARSKIRFGIRRLLIALMAAILFLIAGLVITYDFFAQRRTIVQYTRGALEMLTSTGALSFRGEDLARLNSKGDYALPEYARVYGALKGIYLANKARGIRENAIYILKPSADGNLQFAGHLPGVSTAPNKLGEISAMADAKVNYLGDSYPMSTPIRAVLKGEALHASTDVYADKYGTWVSAYAPIKNARGQVVAVLEADYNFETVRESILTRFLTEAAVVLLGAVVALVLVFFTAGRIVRPIEEVAEAVGRVAGGDFGVRAPVRRADEVGLLAWQFNEMVHALAQRRELSRYVSSDTMRRVESGARGHDTERIIATILFSDVRNFTAYSSRQRAETVVAVLNELLQTQADIVARHGGSVDKFVGDEVMVVFSDDDHLERAVACARDMQAAVRSILTREGIGLGIGVHSGFVVRGDMGSRDRVDHTVIGSTVNLAARLCAHARDGQILAVESLTLDLGDAGITYLGRGRFKGLEQPLRVYDLAQKDPRATGS